LILEADMQRIDIGEVQLNVVDEGRGAPLLLVHGFPLDHSMWAGQIAELSRSCRVIAPDLRGFGQSDATPGTVTMGQFADDLAGLLDALNVREPVTFCGLSMGGYVGWQFVARHANRLGRLIVCDSRSIADTPDGAAGRLKTAEKVLREGASVVAEGMIPKLFSRASLDSNASYVAATREVIRRTSPDGIAAALRGMAERPDVTGQLGRITVPTLVLCGAEDAISGPAEMRTIAEAIPGAQFVEIAGAGHMAPLEKPAEVNNAIRQFLVGK
jgi:pimeloyl-ACP methyl ester carboxylesterase